MAGCGRLAFDERGDGVDGPVGCGHTFCDDFDRTTPVDTGWSSLDTTAGGTGAIDTNQLLLTVPTMTPTMEIGSAVLEVKVPGTFTTHASVELDLAMATTTVMNTEVDLVRLAWDIPPAGCTTFEFVLVRDGTGPFNLQETYDAGCVTGGNIEHFNIDLLNKPIAKIRLEVDSSRTLTLAVDGVEIVREVAAHAVTPSSLTLGIGANVVRNGQTPWMVRYDNVVVDLD